jgi:hypothetical protein
MSNIENNIDVIVLPKTLPIKYKTILFSSIKFIQDLKDKNILTEEMALACIQQIPVFETLSDQIRILDDLYDLKHIEQTIVKPMLQNHKKKMKMGEKEKRGNKTHETTDATEKKKRVYKKKEETTDATEKKKRVYKKKDPKNSVVESVELVESSNVELVESSNVELVESSVVESSVVELVESLVVELIESSNTTDATEKKKRVYKKKDPKNSVVESSNVELVESSNVELVESSNVELVESSLVESSLVELVETPMDESSLDEFVESSLDETPLMEKKKRVYKKKEESREKEEIESQEKAKEKKGRKPKGELNVVFKYDDPLPKEEYVDVTVDGQKIQIKKRNL